MYSATFAAIARVLRSMDCIDTLRANWCYGSAHDGERYEIRLCEPCFFRTLLGLRRDRMVNFMFSDEGQDLSVLGMLLAMIFSMTVALDLLTSLPRQHYQRGA